MASKSEREIWLTASGSLARDPGSCTQFILPFSYEPQKISGGVSDTFYERYYFDEGAPSDRDDPLKGKTLGKEELVYERRRYFTEETGNMLYQHAAWFALRGFSPQRNIFRFDAQSTGRTIQFQWSRPSLTLFNWSVARSLGKRHGGARHRLSSGRTLSNPLLNGFLILEIHPVEPITLAELMEINETFRHLQVPFEDYPKEHLAPRYSDLLEQGFPWVEKNPESLDPSNNDIDEEWRDYTWGKWLDLFEFPLVDQSAGDLTYYRLAPQKWAVDAAKATRHRGWATQDHMLKPAEPKALVWSCAVLSSNNLDARAELLNQACSEVSEQTGSTERTSLRERNCRSGDWIQFLNIDRPPTGAAVTHSDLLNASGYEKDWAHREAITYQRWAHLGTLYGFTGHSGCALLPDIKKLPYWKQWRTIYRDQALFLLYERATLFRFSRSISSLTQDRFVAEGHSEYERQRAERQFEKDFGDLRRHFVSFANLYQFPLLSTEQQSLEMYNAQRAALDIDPLYKEVQSQIDNAHAYASLSAQRKATELTTVITVLGIPLLLSGLIAAIMGMDISNHFEAVRDLLRGYSAGNLVSVASESEAVLTLSIWLVAVFFVLLPLRFFENRLIDVTGPLASSRYTPRIFAVLSAGLGLTALLMAGYVFYISTGWPRMVSAMAILSTLLMARPIRRVRTATKAWRETVIEGPSRGEEIQARYQRLKVVATKAWSFVEALIKRPISTISSYQEFHDIIKKEVRRQELERK